MSGKWVEGGRVIAVSLALARSAPFMSSDLFAQPADHTVSHFFFSILFVSYVFCQWPQVDDAIVIVFYAFLLLGGAS